MPGLLRGVARTAVIAGTATHVSNNVSRRQQNRWAQNDAEQQQQYAEPEPQMSNEDQISQLQQLGKLRDDGILTEQEFTAKKQQILGL